MSNLSHLEGGQSRLDHLIAEPFLQILWCKGRQSDAVETVYVVSQKNAVVGGIFHCRENTSQQVS